MIKWLAYLGESRGLWVTPADPMALMGGLFVLLLSLVALPFLWAHPLLAAGQFARRGWSFLQLVFMAVLLMALIPWDIWQTPPWELVRVPRRARITSCYNFTRSSGERAPFDPAWRGSVLHGEAWLKRRGLLSFVGRDEGERVPPVEYVVPQHNTGSIVVYRSHGREVALVIVHLSSGTRADGSMEVSRLEVRNRIWQTVQATTATGDGLESVFEWRCYYPVATAAAFLIMGFVLLVFLKPEGGYVAVPRAAFRVALLFPLQAFLLGIGCLPVWWCLGLCLNIFDWISEWRGFLFLVGIALVPIALAYGSFRIALHFDRSS